MVQADDETSTALEKQPEILRQVYLLAKDFSTFSCIERSLFYLSTALLPCWSHPNAVDPPTLLSTIPPLIISNDSNIDNQYQKQNQTSDQNNIHTDNNTERSHSRASSLIGVGDIQSALRGNVSFETAFATLFDRYRLVVAVDLSASVVAATLSSSPQDGLPFGQVHTALSKLLIGLTMPVHVPGSDIMYCPTINVTVIAKNPGSAMSVVVQAEYIDANNISAKVAHIVARLWKVERETNRERATTSSSSSSSNLRRQNRHKLNSTTNAKFASNQQLIRTNSRAAPIPTTEPEMSNNRLTKLIELALTSALLRQRDECPVIVIITDGVSDLPDTCAYNNLLMKCRRSDVACNIVQVGAPQQPPNTTFLHVADGSTLDFVARATGGVCIRASHITNPHTSREAVASIVHEVVLWRSSRPAREDEFRVLMADEPRVTLIKEVPRLMAAVEAHYPWMDVPPSPVPLVVNMFTEYRLVLRVCELLQRRVSEGFRLRQLVESSSNSKLILRLALLWQPHVFVNYVVYCSRTSSSKTKIKKTKSSNCNGKRDRTKQTARHDSHNTNTSHVSRRNKVKVEATGAACSSSQPGNMYVELRVLASPEFLLAFHKVGRAKASDRVQVADLAAFKLHQFLNSIVEVDRLLVHICQLPTLADEWARDGMSVPVAPVLVGPLPAPRANRVAEQRKRVFSLLGAATDRWRRWFQVAHMNFVSHFAFDPRAQVSRGNSHCIVRACSDWANLSFVSPTHAIFVKFVASGKVSAAATTETRDISRSASRSTVGHARVRSSGSVASVSGGSEASAVSQMITSTCPGSAAFAMVSLTWDTPLVAALHVAFHMVKAASRNALQEQLRNTVLHALAGEWNKHQIAKPGAAGSNGYRNEHFANVVAPDVAQSYQLISQRNISKLCSVSPGFVDSKLVGPFIRKDQTGDEKTNTASERGNGVNDVFRPTGSARAQALLATPLCCHYGITDMDLKDFFICRKRVFWAPNLSCLRRFVSLLVDARCREGYLLVRGPSCISGTPVEPEMSWLDTSNPIDSTIASQHAPTSATTTTSTTNHGSDQQWRSSSQTHHDKPNHHIHRRISSTAYASHQPSASADSSASRRLSLLHDTRTMASCWEVKPGDELHFLRIVQLIGKPAELLPDKASTNPRTEVSCAVQYFIRVLSDCTLQVSLVSERSSHHLVLCDVWQERMKRRTLSWGEAANALNRHTHDVDARIISTVLSFDGISNLAKRAIASADAVRVQVASDTHLGEISESLTANTPKKKNSNRSKEEGHNAVGVDMCKHAYLGADPLEYLASQRTLPRSAFELHGTAQVRQQLVADMKIALEQFTDAEIPATRLFTSPSNFQRTFSSTGPSDTENNKYFVKMVDASTLILVNMHQPAPELMRDPHQTNIPETALDESICSDSAQQIKSRNTRSVDESITITYSAFEYSKLTCEQLIGQQSDPVVNTLLQLRRMKPVVPTTPSSNASQAGQAEEATYIHGGASVLRSEGSVIDTINALDAQVYRQHRISLTRQLFAALERSDSADDIADDDHNNQTPMLSLDAVEVALEPCIVSRETIDASVLVDCLFDDDDNEDLDRNQQKSPALLSSMQSQSPANQPHETGGDEQQAHVDTGGGVGVKDVAKQQEVFESLTRGFRDELNECFRPVSAAPHLYHLAPTNSGWTRLAELLVPADLHMPGVDDMQASITTNSESGSVIDEPTTARFDTDASPSSLRNKPTSDIGAIKGPGSRLRAHLYSQDSEHIHIETKQHRADEKIEHIHDCTVNDNCAFEFDAGSFVVKNEDRGALSNRAFGPIAPLVITTAEEWFDSADTGKPAPVVNTERPKGFPPLFFSAQVVQFNKSRRGWQNRTHERAVGDELTPGYSSYPIIRSIPVVGGDLGGAVRALVAEIQTRGIGMDESDSHSSFSSDSHDLHLLQDNTSGVESNQPLLDFLRTNSKGSMVGVGILEQEEREKASESENSSDDDEDYGAVNGMGGYQSDISSMVGGDRFVNAGEFGDGDSETGSAFGHSGTVKSVQQQEDARSPGASEGLDDTASGATNSAPGVKYSANVTNSSQQPARKARIGIGMALHFYALRGDELFSLGAPTVFPDILSSACPSALPPFPPTGQPVPSGDETASNEPSTTDGTHSPLPVSDKRSYVVDSNDTGNIDAIADNNIAMPDTGPSHTLIKMIEPVTVPLLEDWLRLVRTHLRDKANATVSNALLLSLLRSRRAVSDAVQLAQRAMQESSALGRYVTSTCVEIEFVNEDKEHCTRVFLEEIIRSPFVKLHRVLMPPRVSTTASRGVLDSTKEEEESEQQEQQQDLVPVFLVVSPPTLPHDIVAIETERLPVEGSENDVPHPELMRNTPDTTEELSATKTTGECENNQDHEDQEQQQAQQQQQQQQQDSMESLNLPYWAVVSISGCQVSLNFHHPPKATPLDTATFMRRLVKALSLTGRRANQRMLLRSLYETREASPLLIPAIPKASVPLLQRRRSSITQFDPEHDSINTALRPCNDSELSLTLGLFPRASSLSPATSISSSNQRFSAFASAASFSHTKSHPSHPRKSLSPVIDPENEELEASKENEEVAPPLDLNASTNLASIPTEQLLSEPAPQEGIYACEAQGGMIFRLFERLNTHKTINRMANFALPSFKIKNRENMFVYRDSQLRVYYIRLSAVRPDEMNSLHAVEGMEARGALGNQNYGIVLEFFGLEPASEEMKTDLRVRIERGLSTLRLEVMRIHQRKQKKFQFTERDFQFLNTSERRKRRFVIDKDVTDVVRFILYLKQTLLESFELVKFGNGPGIERAFAEVVGRTDLAKDAGSGDVSSYNHAHNTPVSIALSDDGAAVEDENTCAASTTRQEHDSTQVAKERDSGGLVVCGNMRLTPGDSTNTHPSLFATNGWFMSQQVQSNLQPSSSTLERSSTRSVKVRKIKRRAIKFDPRTTLPVFATRKDYLRQVHLVHMLWSHMSFVHVPHSKQTSSTATASAKTDKATPSSSTTSSTAASSKLPAGEPAAMSSSTESTNFSPTDDATTERQPQQQQQQSSNWNGVGFSSLRVLAAPNVGTDDIISWDDAVRVDRFAIKTKHLEQLCQQDSLRFAVEVSTGGRDVDFENVLEVFANAFDRTLQEYRTERALDKACSLLKEGGEPRLRDLLPNPFYLEELGMPDYINNNSESADATGELNVVPGDDGDSCSGESATFVPNGNNRRLSASPSDCSLALSDSCSWHAGGSSQQQATPVIAPSGVNVAESVTLPATDEATVSATNVAPWMMNDSNTKKLARTIYQRHIAVHPRIPARDLPLVRACLARQLMLVTGAENRHKFAFNSRASSATGDVVQINADEVLSCTSAAAGTRLTSRFGNDWSAQNNSSRIFAHVVVASARPRPSPLEYMFVDDMDDTADSEDDSEHDGVDGSNLESSNQQEATEKEEGECDMEPDLLSSTNAERVTLATEGVVEESLTPSVSATLEGTRLDKVLSPGGARNLGNRANSRASRTGKTSSSSSISRSESSRSGFGGHRKKGLGSNQILLKRQVVKNKLGVSVSAGHPNMVSGSNTGTAVKLKHNKIRRGSIRSPVTEVVSLMARHKLQQQKLNSEGGGERPIGSSIGGNVGGNSNIRSGVGNGSVSGGVEGSIGLANLSALKDLACHRDIYAASEPYHEHDPGSNADDDDDDDDDEHQLRQQHLRASLAGANHSYANVNSSLNTVSAPKQPPRLLFRRHQYAAVVVSCNAIIVWNYNWKRSVVEEFEQRVLEVVSWIARRRQLLQTVIHFKMCLRLHLDYMGSAVVNYAHALANSEYSAKLDEWSASSVPASQMLQLEDSISSDLANVVRVITPPLPSTFTNGGGAGGAGASPVSDITAASSERNDGKLENDVTDSLKDRVADSSASTESANASPVNMLPISGANDPLRSSPLRSMRNTLQRVGSFIKPSSSLAETASATTVTAATPMKGLKQPPLPPSGASSLSLKSEGASSVLTTSTAASVSAGSMGMLARLRAANKGGSGASRFAPRSRRNFYTEQALRAVGKNNSGAGGGSATSSVASISRRSSAMSLVSTVTGASASDNINSNAQNCRSASASPAAGVAAATPTSEGILDTASIENATVNTGLKNGFESTATIRTMVSSDSLVSTVKRRLETNIGGIGAGGGADDASQIGDGQGQQQESHSNNNKVNIIPRHPALVPIQNSKWRDDADPIHRQVAHFHSSVLDWHTRHEQGGRLMHVLDILFAVAAPKQPKFLTKPTQGNNPARPTHARLTRRQTALMLRFSQVIHWSRAPIWFNSFAPFLRPASGSDGKRFTVDGHAVATAAASMGSVSGGGLASIGGGTGKGWAFAEHLVRFQAIKMEREFGLRRLILVNEDEGDDNTAASAFILNKRRSISTVSYTSATSNMNETQHQGDRERERQTKITQRLQTDPSSVFLWERFGENLLIVHLCAPKGSLNCNFYLADRRAIMAANNRRWSSSGDADAGAPGLSTTHGLSGLRWSQAGNMSSGGGGRGVVREAAAALQRGPQGVFPDVTHILGLLNLRCTLHDFQLGVLHDLACNLSLSALPQELGGRGDGGSVATNTKTVQILSHLLDNNTLVGRSDSIDSATPDGRAPATAPALEDAHCLAVKFTIFPDFPIGFGVNDLSRLLEFLTVGQRHQRNGAEFVRWVDGRVGGVTTVLGCDNAKRSNDVQAENLALPIHVGVACSHDGDFIAAAARLAQATTPPLQSTGSNSQYTRQTRDAVPASSAVRTTSFLRSRLGGPLSRPLASNGGNTTTSQKIGTDLVLNAQELAHYSLVTRASINEKGSIRLDCCLMYKPAKLSRVWRSGNNSNNIKYDSHESSAEESTSGSDSDDDDSNDGVRTNDYETKRARLMFAKDKAQELLAREFVRAQFLFKKAALWKLICNGGFTGTGSERQQQQQQQNGVSGHVASGPTESSSPCVPITVVGFDAGAATHLELSSRSRGISVLGVDENRSNRGNIMRVAAVSAPKCRTIKASDLVLFAEDMVATKRPLAQLYGPALSLEFLQMEWTQFFRFLEGVYGNRLVRVDGKQVCLVVPPSQQHLDTGRGRGLELNQSRRNGFGRATNGLGAQEAAMEHVGDEEEHEKMAILIKKADKKSLSFSLCLSQEASVSDVDLHLVRELVDNVAYLLWTDIIHSY